MNRNLKILVSIPLLFAASGAFAQGTPIDSGATSWMLTSTALVLLMVPGLAMFYGGLVRSKNVLGTMMHSFAAMGIMTILWAVCGYSMSFGQNVLGGWFGWNPDYYFLQGIDEKVMSAGIPEYVFTMFQGKFAIITPALIAGAFAERVHVEPVGDRRGLRVRRALFHGGAGLPDALDARPAPDALRLLGALHVRHLFHEPPESYRGRHRHRDRHRCRKPEAGARCLLP